MVYAIFLGTMLIVLTSVIHFSALNWMSRKNVYTKRPSNFTTFWVVSGVFVLHMFEIILYAFAYWFSEQVLQIGSLEGLGANIPYDYLYYSTVTFTSLGIGDVFPTGHIRFLTGVEALNGLLLIAGSASFIYFALSNVWKWER